VLPLIFRDGHKLQAAPFDKIARVQNVGLIRITFRVITNHQARKVLQVEIIHDIKDRYRGVILGQVSSAADIFKSQPPHADIVDLSDLCETGSNCSISVSQSEKANIFSIFNNQFYLFGN
jgi:hypothetical protein